MPVGTSQESADVSIPQSACTCPAGHVCHAALLQPHCRLIFPLANRFFLRQSYRDQKKQHAFATTCFLRHEIQQHKQPVAATLRSACRAAKATKRRLCIEDLSRSARSVSQASFSAKESGVIALRMDRIQYISRFLRVSKF